MKGNKIMSINIKRTDSNTIKTKPFREIDVGGFFEDREDEILFFKISEEDAIEVGDYCASCFADDYIVNEVDVEISYKRQYEKSY
jgi:hypothetical protein